MAGHWIRIETSCRDTSKKMYGLIWKDQVETSSTIIRMKKIVNTTRDTFSYWTAFS